MASDPMFQKPRLISSSRDGKATFSKMRHQIKRSCLKLHLSSFAMLLLRDESTVNPGSCHIASANNKLSLLCQSKGNNTDNFLFLPSTTHHSAKTTTWVSPTLASPPRIISKVLRTVNMAMATRM
jgi:hypothetical protein